MTTVYERTRSVIETGVFLDRLARDGSLPQDIREQAKHLLRHYPTAQAVKLAGKCEEIRQYEISKLPISRKALHPALASWPVLDPFFSDLTNRNTPEPIIPTTAAPRPQLTASTLGMRLAVGSRVLGLTQSTRIGCLSVDYRCFASARAQVLSYATVVLGSRASATTWFESPIRSLNRRQPCTLIRDANTFTEIMNVLARIEYGVYQ